ncbi:hypothetical protein C3L33_09473, partial [Rhododendron williamsianum]
MSEAEKKVEEAAAKMKKQGGELLFCGATRWNANISSRKNSNAGNLVSPTRLRPLLGVDIRLVVSGCGSSHCVALDKGQLGHGDRILRDGPSLVSELLGHNIIGAGAGRSHTLVVTKDGISLSFGCNKHGQLGSGSLKNVFESSPIRCLVSEVRDAACGADFSVWLSSIEGASILTAGLPQYGQLGHGTNKECLIPPYFLSFGFRLGHKEQKDEWVPRRVEIFTKHNVLPPDALIAAGSVNSACTAGRVCSEATMSNSVLTIDVPLFPGEGQLYMWGKVKNKGDEWMYPKPVMDLSGWNIRCMDSGDMRHFVGAESSCISWGNALSGELGYGPDAQNVACGLSHSMVVVDRTDVGDRLDQIDVYDGEALST